MKFIFRKTVWLMLLFISQVTLAQDKMLNISAGGGVEILKYTPEIGKPKPGGSVTLECQFQQFLTNNFGYGAGVDISYLTANYYISETIETPITDETDAGIPYTLRTIFDDFNEKQKSFLVEGPVGLYARVPSKYVHFIVGAGIKVGLPIVAKYDYSRGTVETRAYFGDDVDAELSKIPHHGLYKQGTNAGDIDINRLQLSLYADIMWRFIFNDASPLHFGAYISYGLNDMVSNHDATMGIHKNSILNSTLTDKIVPICIGLKIGLAIPFEKGGKRSIFDGFR